jgi:hypothetical protein
MRSNANRIFFPGNTNLAKANAAIDAKTTVKTVLIEVTTRLLKKYREKLPVVQA